MCSAHVCFLFYGCVVFAPSLCRSVPVLPCGFPHASTRSLRAVAVPLACAHSQLCLPYVPFPFRSSVPVKARGCLCSHLKLVRMMLAVPRAAVLGTLPACDTSAGAQGAPWEPLGSPASPRESPCCFQGSPECLGMSRGCVSAGPARCSATALITNTHKSHSQKELSSLMLIVARPPLC